MRPTHGVSRQDLPARDGCGNISMRNGSSPTGHRAHGGLGRCWLAVLRYALLLFVFDINTAQADVQYLYDEANRLVQAVDTAGDAAHYQYDAAGNIVAVHRYGAGDLAITEFMPESGPIGTTVTIYGVGFSPTPANNLVAFNGTAATVSAANNIKLVTQVPVGTATGPILVTVGSGTATSSKPFTVTTDPLHAPPIITSFSPNIGPVGTIVTMVGQYFEPTITNNIVKFNITRANPTSSAATQIISDVPTGATSGHLYVRTPYGAATSSGDFFLPPVPYTPADVGVATRITADGPSLPINTASAGKIAMVLFDGMQGQTLGLGLSPMTFTPAGGSGSVRIYSPLGAQILSSSISAATSVDVPVLPTTGTYTIVLIPPTTASLSATLTLSSDIEGVLTAGAAPQTFSTTRIGQNARYSFSATAGQNLSLLFSGDIFPGYTFVYVYKPDGTQLAYTYLYYTSGAGMNATLDLNNLPVTGTYRVFVTPSGVATGSMNVSLQAEASGTPAIDGGATAVSLAAGQNGRYTFTGSAGQGFGLGVANLVTTPSGGTVSVTVYKPDGTSLIACGSYNAPGGSCDVPLLPVNGTYAIFVDPGVNAASLDLLLSTDAAAILTPGAVQTFSTTRIGQNARYSFSATAGQNLSLLFSEDVFPGYTYAYVYKPDGTYLTNTYLYYSSGAGSTGTLDLNNLPVTGTYRVFVTPSGVATGSMNVSLQAEASGTPAIDGGATAVSLAAGQNGRYTFTGTTGQGFGLGITNVVTAPSGGTVTVTVYKPDGAVLQNCAAYSATGGSCDVPLLPVSGTYSVFVDPGVNAASLKLLLSADLTGALTRGAVQTFSTTRAGQNARYSFAGTAGQNLSLLFSRDVFRGFTYAYVYKPDGTYLTNTYLYYSSGAGTGTTLNLTNLPATGTYKVFITPSGVATGSIKVRIP